MGVIAIVEDDPGVSMLLELKLGSAGHSTYVERDGEAGLAAIRLNPPDLVLLDWMLPRVTGLEVCVAIRDDATLRATPIILLTSRTQEDDVVRGLRAGADDYVVKPFSPVELLGRVERLITAPARR
jgi:DNA-binding response OmpR family regulator